MAGTAVSVATVLMSSWVQAAIDIIVAAPASGAIVGDSLPDNATVNSTFQLTSVKATLGAAQSDLVYNAGPYAGTLNLSAEPSGNQNLTVSATDIYGATGSIAVPVLLN
jgi:hypothetical protein